MECILSSMADAIPSFRNLYLRNITSFVVNLMFMAAYFGVPCFLQVSTAVHIRSILFMIKNFLDFYDFFLNKRQNNVVFEIVSVFLIRSKISVNKIFNFSRSA